VSTHPNLLNPDTQCPVPQCQRAKRPNHLMCLLHWHMVPADLQQTVWVHARAMLAAKGMARLAALKEWGQARERAVSAVEEKILQRHARREERAGPSLEFD
jgi:hypothetical protein